MELLSRRKFLTVIILASLVPLLWQPVFVAASEKEELERLISRTNERRDTPEKVAIFKDKCKEYYYVSGSVMDGLLKEFTPGEAMVIISMATLSQKEVKEVAQIKKDVAEWSKTGEKFGIVLKDVIKDIRKFQRDAG